MTESADEAIQYYKKYFPPVTAICCFISAVLFIGINLEPGGINWFAYTKWGAPPPDNIWNGAYWGLITSNFLHTEPWHILLNLVAFWWLGKKIEFESGSAFLFAFTLSAALVSSLSELAFSGNSGIGLSGIAYAFVGFIYIKGKSDNGYSGYMSKANWNWFLLWLLICIVLTYTEVISIGNAAHIMGLLWGLLLGKLSGYSKVLTAIVAVLLLGLSSGTIFWMPWSVPWLSNKAYQLHTQQKLEEAEKIYAQILAIEKDNEFAADNLKNIRIYKLSMAASNALVSNNFEEARRLYREVLKLDSANAYAASSLVYAGLDTLVKQAYKAHIEFRYDEARELYNRILEIDSSHAWAKQNLKQLP